MRISAAFDSETGRLSLTVRDTGIGIAPQDLTRIFEEFSQVETRIHKRVKGMGLGLPLSKSLAEILGGELTVESVPSGSVFTLSIPPERGDPSRAKRAADNERKRVLLIDDDETFRYVMRQIVTSEPRYEYIEAVDGDAGLKVAREQNPDVIILDLQMPTVDGFNVLQELSADGRTSATPVIVSTSLNVNAELKARLPAGVRFIAKNTISRESVSLFLRDATVAAP